MLSFNSLKKGGDMYFNVISKESEKKSVAGLQSYFCKVYSYMMTGLLMSALAAFLGTKEPLVSMLYKVTPQGMTWSGLGWIVMFAPLGMIFFMGSALRNLNIAKAQGMFWIFSILMGLSLSNIFFVYSSGSIVRTFLITSATFGGMSLYGYTTKRSLYGLGSFLVMGLWGMIIASVVNIFMHSSSLDWMLSFLGVGIFTGLTAYDTQQLKEIYSENDVTDVQEAKAISGALSLYLNFINLFVSLLRLLGNRE